MESAAGGGAATMFPLNSVPSMWVVGGVGWGGGRGRGRPLSTRIGSEAVKTLRCATSPSLKDGAESNKRTVLRSSCVKIWPISCKRCHNTPTVMFWDLIGIEICRERSWHLKWAQWEDCSQLFIQTRRLMNLIQTIRFIFLRFSPIRLNLTSREEVRRREK